MAAIFENRKFQRPAINASTRKKRGFRPYAFAGLALSAVIALAVPSTQAVSSSFAPELAANGAVMASPTITQVLPTQERRASAVTPRPMTSNDRQAIFMVLMLRDPNASSQILGLTH